MPSLVVGWDGNVDVLCGRVGVAESNNGNVDIRSLANGLSISTGIGDNDEARFFEGSSDVIGEATGREASGNGNGTGMSSKLEYSSLTIWSSGNDTNVCWVVDGDYDPCCQNDFFPLHDC